MPLGVLATNIVSIMKMRGSGYFYTRRFRSVPAVFEESRVLPKLKWIPEPIQKLLSWWSAYWELF